MEYANLETAALAHVDDSYYYGEYCRKCKHSARLFLTKLRAHLGDDFPLIKVREKLRCQSLSLATNGSDLHYSAFQTAARGFRSFGPAQADLPDAIRRTETVRPIQHPSQVP
jgi:hypothetical protein